MTRFQGMGSSVSQLWRTRARLGLSGLMKVWQVMQVSVGKARVGRPLHRGMAVTAGKAKPPAWKAWLKGTGWSTGRVLCSKAPTATPEKITPRGQKGPTPIPRRGS